MQSASYIAPVLDLVATPRTGLLLALLVAAAVIDVRTYRIPNLLTGPGMLAGLVASTLAAGSPMTGFLNGAAGLFAALLLLLPLHALRAIGAGDVKLAAACGAFLGWPDILPALFFIVVAGGVMALGWSLVQRTTGRAASNVAQIAQSVFLAALLRTGMPNVPVQSAGRLPYAVCILVGTATFLVVRQVL